MDLWYLFACMKTVVKCRQKNQNMMGLFELDVKTQVRHPTIE